MSCENNPCFCEKLAVLQVQFKLNPEICRKQGWLIEDDQIALSDLADISAHIGHCAYAHGLYEYARARSGWRTS